MTSGLSNRGDVAAKPNDGMLLWTIIKDLWDPKDNPGGYVSLGIAENTLMHDKLSAHIHANLAVPNHSFTYGDGMTGSKRLKASLARFLTERLKPLGDRASGLGAREPGRGFLLGQPHYGAFFPDVEYRTGCKLVQVPFHEVDPFGLDAVRKYEDALSAARAKGTRIAALILCHPHNPLGRCYPRETIVGLMRLCQEHDMHLISDEIYALSVWNNTLDTDPAPVPFESCLSISTAGVMDPRRLHVLWGMSKDFGANGIRLGAVVSQHNPALHDSLTPVGIYSSPSAIADHATANILDDRAWVDGYVEENRRRLQESFELVAGWARDGGIEYARGANAAFFLWVDLGKAYRARRPGREVRDVAAEVMAALLEKKVFLASGEQFGSERPGWFRIVFSNNGEVVSEGLRRIAAHTDGDIGRQLSEGNVYVDSVILQTLQDYPRWDQEGALLRYKPLNFDKIHPGFRDVWASWYAVVVFGWINIWNAEKVDQGPVEYSDFELDGKFMRRTKENRAGIGPGLIYVQ
ncbi:1-aminocyclopropane-1-carboxylate synthase-like protein 1 [Colletotrichum shisoi]|uniref:1-aminocyclopropane-1-carboxylate synthase-like protein 1 n=1 Tax=Colletotrichum shisoi TaxID=2078593 RepID=A0A5Q4BI36_9PEZI|nr:1-aminocyclopropane-1-carboxylate synthase-like protein 1 [Colletotrichum shisoi]